MAEFETASILNGLFRPLLLSFLTNVNRNRFTFIVFNIPLKKNIRKMWMNVNSMELYRFAFVSFVLPQKMDLNCDGVVTLDEFLECCRNDEMISRSLHVFDSGFWQDAQVSDDPLAQQQQQPITNSNGGPASITGKKPNRSSSAPKTYHHHNQQHHPNFQHPPPSACQYSHNYQYNQPIYHQYYPQQVSS